MEVVINIPEWIYNDIKNGFPIAVKVWYSELANIIKNGIQIPQNHGDLKDVDAIIDKLLEVGWLDGEEGDELESIFNLFPAIVKKVDMEVK